MAHMPKRTLANHPPTQLTQQVHTDITHIHTRTHATTHTITHSLDDSLNHSLIHSFNILLIHSRTQSLSHSPRYYFWLPFVLYCIQVFIQCPSAALGQQGRFWFDELQEKRQVLRSDKDVERLDDNKEAPSPAALDITPLEWSFSAGLKPAPYISYSPNPKHRL